LAREVWPRDGVQKEDPGKRKETKYVSVEKKRERKRYSLYGAKKKPPGPPSENVVFLSRFVRLRC